MSSTRKKIPFRLDGRIAFWSILFAVGLLLEVLVRERILSPASYAAPSEVMVACIRLLATQDFLRDIAYTTGRAVLGVVIGFPLGVLVAIGLSAMGRAQRSGERLLDFVRSIPITALIPLFIAIYGVGERNKIAIAVTSAFLVTAVTAWIGIKQSLARSSLLLRLYDPPPLKRTFLVVLPYALPNLVAALRLAVSSSVVLVVVGEMFIGTLAGVGKVINDKAYGDDRAGQYAAIFCTGILGYLLNLVFERISHLPLPGLMTDRDGQDS